jgi:hypothetical protein
MSRLVTQGTSLGTVAVASKWPRKAMPSSQHLTGLSVPPLLGPNCELTDRLQKGKEQTGQYESSLSGRQVF